MRIAPEDSRGKATNVWGLKGIAATWTYLRLLVDLWTAAVVLTLSFGVLGMLLWQADSIGTGLKDAIREIIISARVEIDSYFNPNQLPTMYIDMDLESFQRIVENRNEAIRLNRLRTTDDDFVSAELQYMGNSSIPVRMRLKGDSGDHWLGDKWSYRIHVLGDDQVAGMRRFSIQDPMTRQLINEWMFHQMLLKEDILTTRYSFVNVVFNGQFKGTYALEESFSEELLAAQQRPLGVMLRYPDDPDKDIGSTLNTPEVYRGSSVARDPVLSSQAEAATKMLLDGESSEIYDNDRLGRLIALMDLWDAGHGIGPNNLRYYYNPITAQLEPIGYDASPVLILGNTESSVGGIPSTDPLRAGAYMSELIKISEIAHLEEFRADISDQLDIFMTALRREYLSLEAPWQQLSERQAILRQELTSGLFIVGLGEIRMKPYPHLFVDITNFSSFPLTIESISIDDKSVKLQMEWLASDGQGMRSNAADDIILTPFAIENAHGNARIDSDRRAVRFEIPLEKLELSGQLSSPPVSLSILVHSTQHVEGEIIPISVREHSSESTSSPMPPVPTIAEFLEKHAFASIDADTMTIRIESGDWDVKGDLVLPQYFETIISPDATLSFEEGAVLLATTPISIRGTAEQPVILTAKRDSWAGAAIIGAADESIWEHVLIEKTKGIDRNGWILTGGVTFYESPARLEYVQVVGSEAEDAVNVVRSVYEFRHIEFASTYSDALDSDYSQGRIAHSEFRDIGGDAIDISGSKLTLSFSEFSSVADKAVSAGERSSVEMDNVRIHTVGIGIASKDSSGVLVTETTISNAKHAALAAFIKKPEYGPATIDAEKLTVVDTGANAMVQTNSKVTVNGVALSTSDLDVDALYAQGVLGN